MSCTKEQRKGSLGEEGGTDGHAPRTGCVPPSRRSRNLQCQRIFQVNAPINCVCLHPNQVRGPPEAGHPGALEGRGAARPHLPDTSSGGAHRG